MASGIDLSLKSNPVRAHAGRLYPEGEPAKCRDCGDVDEFTFRLNDGDVKRHTLKRLDSFVDALMGKRLTYAELIA